MWNFSGLVAAPRTERNANEWLRGETGLWRAQAEFVVVFSKFICHFRHDFVTANGWLRSPFFRAGNGHLLRDLVSMQVLKNFFFNARFFFNQNCL